MDESAQVQALLDGALAVANALSLEGRHLDAGRIAGLIQLARVQRTLMVAQVAVGEEGK